VRPVGGWEAGHKTLLAMDRALLRRPPAPRDATIALSPTIGAEAGPKHWLGDVPYQITAVGQGFPPGTLARIQFEDDMPVITMTDVAGRLRETVTGDRRSAGIYHVVVEAGTVRAQADFRVVELDDPVPDPQRERLYGQHLRDATRMLRDSFFGTPLSPDFEHDHFDTDFWQWEGDPKYNRVLRLKPGRSPSQAIDALFARLNLWQIDCDHTVQIANLYAMRMTYGSALFDHREGLRMVLRSRESSGLTTRRHYGREGIDARWRIVHDFVPPNTFKFASGPPLPAGTEEIVARAPVGSRVRWTNLAADTSDSFRHENTVKLGPDLYAAGGLDDPITGNEFTRTRLEIELALHTHPRPSLAYIRRNIYIDEVEVFDR
jgi:hypothetical protein